MNNLYCLTCGDRVWGEDDAELPDDDIAIAKEDHAESHPDKRARWIEVAPRGTVVDLNAETEVGGFRVGQLVAVNDGTNEESVLPIKGFAILGDQGIAATFEAHSCVYLDMLEPAQA